MKNKFIIEPKLMNFKGEFCLTVLLFLIVGLSKGQPKAISPNLFGVFFEDLSYAADGGLYAELLQNGSFEYSPTDHNSWNSFTSWDFLARGNYGYGILDAETTSPINKNNTHYLTLRIENTGKLGIGIANNGFDGIAIDAGKKYRFSVWLRSKGGKPMNFKLSLEGNRQNMLGRSKVSCKSSDWQRYETVITATGSSDSARLILLAEDTGTVDIDMVSLFPEETFKNRPNGMRKDLADAIAALHPKFMRFPGGCLTHGDGVANIYYWKNTIGPLETRKQQRNIWNYHQSFGLGYFEYFQFCEDIGAQPLPVLAAGVSCQNSGGVRGTGQQCVPMEDMPQYIQDILDLIEYANGDASTTWGAKRAAAGHPAPFHLQFIGIGNEDKQTDDFRVRFKMIYDAIKSQYPEITVIGTVGPNYHGEDYDLGWQFADSIHVPMVDEHYYESPKWFIQNQGRYDSYNRHHSKVYIGEYASHGNTLFNALAEAAYMTAMERNGDLVSMASYAPLLANVQHISWRPDMIYFDNRQVLKTANYYIQQLFCMNSGTLYYPSVVKSESGVALRDSVMAASAVENQEDGSFIIKIVNLAATDKRVKFSLPKKFRTYKVALKTVVSGQADWMNSMEEPDRILPRVDSTVEVLPITLELLPYSLTVIKMHK